MSSVKNPTRRSGGGGAEIVDQLGSPVALRFSRLRDSLQVRAIARDLGDIDALEAAS